MDVVKHLCSLAEFCEIYSYLISAHTVNFITGNTWSIVPKNLGMELLNLTEKELRCFLLGDYSISLKRRCPHLCCLIDDAKLHTIETMTCFQTHLPTKYSGKIETHVGPINMWMTPKKSYEVQIMTSTISTLMNYYGVYNVVDFGTGKGYLSAHLALNQNVNIFAIDNNESICCAAKEMNAKVASKFVNQKSKELKNQLGDIRKDCSKKVKDINFNTSNNRVFICEALNINNQTCFDDVIKGFLATIATSPGCNEGKSHNKLLFCALHACGNLFSSILKHFIEAKDAKVLCSIGCCYHHIQEQFSQDFEYNEGSGENAECGFPLSSVLKKKEFKLGRNARMLASQSIHRVAKNSMFQQRGLFYRAMLQVLLHDKGENTADIRVGKLVAKCTNFHQYVRKALKKLNLGHIKISDVDINSYLEKYSNEEKKLCAFQFLRILLAPCVEALIILDRLVYLLEQKEIEEAFIMQMFDPVISPRCYAVIAVKN